MQAIMTKILPATNTLPTRVKAWCERGRITIAYPHELSGAEVHRHAAGALLDAFAADDAAERGGNASDHHWGEFVTGQIGDDYVHVLLGRFAAAHTVCDNLSDGGAA